MYEKEREREREREGDREREKTLIEEWVVHVTLQTRTPA